MEPGRLMILQYFINMAIQEITDLTGFRITGGTG
jgi:hypothetical protein